MILIHPYKNGWLVLGWSRTCMAPLLCYFQEEIKYADQCIGHFFTCKYVIAENNLLHLKPKLHEKDNIL
jgi:hypothetical protein